MKSLTDEKLAKATAGDLATLVKLDDQGLLLGPDESLADYTERLRALEKKIRELGAELTKHGEYDFHGIPLIKADMIPAAVFRSCRQTTRKLFGFALDWVPGFFTDKRMGLLFAGCSLYSLKDFFAVFLIIIPPFIIEISGVFTFLLKFLSNILNINKCISGGHFSSYSLEYLLSLRWWFKR